jgi:hypothetical protein
MFSVTTLTINDADFVLLADRARCALCDYTCVAPNTMERHVNKVHKKVSPYVCENCGRRFHSKTGLGYHVQIEHEGKKKPARRLTEEEKLGQKRVCNCCGKLMNIGNLRKHAEIQVIVMNALLIY